MIARVYCSNFAISDIVDLTSFLIIINLLDKEEYYICDHRPVVVVVRKIKNCIAILEPQHRRKEWSYERYQ